MANRFAGKNAIVTGAGSGIGRAIALALAREKARVAVTDIVAERVEMVVSQLKTLGTDARGWVVDHADPEKSREFFAEFTKEIGPCHILCANAGIAIAGRIEEMSVPEWRRIVDVNLFGAVYMIQNAVPGMIQRQGGDILVTASCVGLAAIPGLAAYSATKYALVGLCESLRMELSKHRINVSVLCPGVINTGILDSCVIHHVNEKGESGEKKITDFYRTRGANPSVVARDALKGLKRSQAVIPSPGWHVWPGYALRRISPALYARVGGLVFQAVQAHMDKKPWWGAWSGKRAGSSDRRWERK